MSLRSPKWAKCPGTNKMNKLQELRARIAKGEIKTGGHTSGPKVGAGVFVVRVDDANLGRGESGNPRGLIKVVVTEAEDRTAIGGSFNMYIQTVNAKMLEESIALYTEILTATGVKEDAIFEDAEDYLDVIENIMGQINKKVRRGGFYLVVNRKEQKQLDSNGRVRYYNDVISEASIKENLPKDETSAAKTEAPAAEAPAEAPEAKDEAPAAEAAKPRKQWSR